MKILVHALFLEIVIIIVILAIREDIRARRTHTVPQYNPTYDFVVMILSIYVTIGILMDLP